MKKNLITLILMCLAIGSFAQTHDLTPEEIEAFKVQCTERIDAFQMGLEIIGDKRQPDNIKDHYIYKSIPEMFMGEGKEWYSWAEVKGELVKVPHAPVHMQVSNVKTGNITPIPLLEYLPKLRTRPFDFVKIKKAATCRMSNIYKVNDNLYMATCTFFQYFTGITGETIVYRDKTQKDVDVYIQRVEDGSLGTYWDMKFGDINVVHTEPM